MGKNSFDDKGNYLVDNNDIAKKHFGINTEKELSAKEKNDLQKFINLINGLGSRNE
jgi:hypothetical protein